MSTDRNLLTPREISILTLIARGYPDKQIADDLGIARSTVSNAVAVILLKLGAANRTEAAVIGLRNGDVN